VKSQEIEMTCVASQVLLRESPTTGSVFKVGYASKMVADSQTGPESVLITRDAPLEVDSKYKLTIEKVG